MANVDMDQRPSTPPPYLRARYYFESPLAPIRHPRMLRPRAASREYTEGGEGNLLLPTEDPADALEFRTELEGSRNGSRYHPYSLSTPPTRYIDVSGISFSPTNVSKGTVVWEAPKILILRRKAQLVFTALGAWGHHDDAKTCKHPVSTVTLTPRKHRDPHHSLIWSLSLTAGFLFDLTHW